MKKYKKHNVIFTGWFVFVSLLLAVALITHPLSAQDLNALQDYQMPENPAVSMEEFCQNAVDYQPSGDVEFTPGKDVRDNPVKGPNLNGSDNFDFEIIFIELNIDDLEALNLPRDSLISPEAWLGMAIVSDGEVTISDQYITQDRITAACRQARENNDETMMDEKTE